MKEIPEIVYHIWFSMLKISKEERKEFKAKYGNIKKVYEELTQNRKKEKELKYRVRKDVYGDIFPTLELAKQIYEEGLIRKIDCISYLDYRYPTQLKQIYEPPYVIYLKGKKELLQTNIVGVIGARECSTYGARIAKKISERIVRKNYTIISGLALGIDTIGHITALTNKKNTIAVIGGGINEETFYPKVNLEVFQKISQSGLIVSEYPYYMNASRYTFPARNRIIAGMSEALFVAEAKLKSGTLITAEFAYENGKNIYVPLGPIDDARFYGTNKLIFDGAIPITNIDDLDDYI